MTARRRLVLLANLGLDVVVASRKQALPDTHKPRSLKERVNSRRVRRGVSQEESESPPDVSRIAIRSPRTLLAFFDERYLALQKQLGRSSTTVNKDLALSAGTVAARLAEAADTPGSVCGIPAGPWWVAQILTSYDTGLRMAARAVRPFAHMPVDFEVPMARASCHSRFEKFQRDSLCNLADKLKNTLFSRHISWGCLAFGPVDAVHQRGIFCSRFDALKVARSTGWFGSLCQSNQPVDLAT